MLWQKFRETLNFIVFHSYGTYAFSCSNTTTCSSKLQTKVCTSDFASNNAVTIRLPSGTVAGRLQLAVLRDFIRSVICSSFELLGFLFIFIKWPCWLHICIDACASQIVVLLPIASVQRYVYRSGPISRCQPNLLDHFPERCTHVQTRAKRPKPCESIWLALRTVAKVQMWPLWSKGKKFVHILRSYWQDPNSLQVSSSVQCANQSLKRLLLKIVSLTFLEPCCSSCTQRLGMTWLFLILSGRIFEIREQIPDISYTDIPSDLCGVMFCYPARMISIISKSWWSTFAETRKHPIAGRPTWPRSVRRPLANVLQVWNEHWTPFLLCPVSTASTRATAQMLRIQLLHQLLQISHRYQVGVGLCTVGKFTRVRRWVQCTRFICTPSSSCRNSNQTIWWRQVTRLQLFCEARLCNRMTVSEVCGVLCQACHVVLQMCSHLRCSLKGPSLRRQTVAASLSCIHQRKRRSRCQHTRAAWSVKSGINSIWDRLR